MSTTVSLRGGASNPSNRREVAVGRLLRRVDGQPCFRTASVDSSHAAVQSRVAGLGPTLPFVDNAPISRVGWLAGAARRAKLLPVRLPFVRRERSLCPKLPSKYSSPEGIPAMTETYGSTLTNDGVRIAYRTFAEGPRNLLLLHGWAGSAASWEGSARSLDPKKCRAIAYDLRGHSDSVMSGFTDERFAHDAQAVADAVAPRPSSPLATS